MEATINGQKIKIEPFSIYPDPVEGVESLEKIPKERLNDNTIYMVKNKKKVDEEGEEKEIVYYDNYLYLEGEFVPIEKAPINDQDPLNPKE